MIHTLPTITESPIPRSLVTESHYVSPYYEMTESRSVTPRGPSAIDIAMDTSTFYPFNQRATTNPPDTSFSIDDDGSFSNSANLETPATASDIASVQTIVETILAFQQQEIVSLHSKIDTLFLKLNNPESLETPATSPSQRPSGQRYAQLPGAAASCFTFHLEACYIPYSVLPIWDHAPIVIIPEDVEITQERDHHQAVFHYFLKETFFRKYCHFIFRNGTRLDISCLTNQPQNNTHTELKPSCVMYVVECSQYFTSTRCHVRAGAYTRAGIRIRGDDSQWGDIILNMPTEFNDTIFPSTLCNYALYSARKSGFDHSSIVAYAKQQLEWFRRFRNFPLVETNGKRSTA